MRQEPSPAIKTDLRDGTPVVLRPILPEDKGRLREGFHHLSEQSRYRRFAGSVNELSEDQLRYLTEVDQRDHIAWIALDPRVPGEPALGVARCVRLKEEPEVAEGAVVVADPVQGKGLGTALLGTIAFHAVENGIRWFRAYVLIENRPMLEILNELGGTVALEEPGMYRVDVALPKDPEDLPDTPTGRMFKAVARKVLPAPTVLRRTAPYLDN